MNGPIDFEVLDQLDAEADRLILSGQWTRERFEELWQKGLSAAHQDVEALEFLRLAAEPSWLPEDQEGRGGAGFARIPRKVTEMIYRLKDGWEPRVVFARAGSLAWDGELLPSVSAEVTFDESELRIDGLCGRDDMSRIEREMRRTPGSLLRNEVRLTCPEDWVVEVSNAALRSIQSSWKLGLHSTGFKATANSWRARRADVKESPGLWIAEILTSPGYHFGNLMVQRAFFTPSIAMVNEIGWGGGWGYLCLQGRYTYYLVEAKNGQAKKRYFILDPGGQEDVDPEALHLDLLALQFVLGSPLVLGVLHGIYEGTFIIALMSVYQRWGRGHGGPGLAIPQGLDAEQWIAPLFRALSQASSDKARVGLMVAVDAYVDSASGTIDRQILGLLTALTSLSSWILDEADGQAPQLVDASEKWEAWINAHQAGLRELTGESHVLALSQNLRQANRLTPRQRLARALEKLRIAVPGQILEEIEVYRERIQSFGRLTHLIDRSGEEIEREIRLNDCLRTLLVAIVAASVEYHGPIRAQPWEHEPPLWWPVNPGEASEQRSYVAISAPVVVKIPAVAGEDVLLLLERPHHEIVVRNILEAYGLATSRVKIVTAEGREGLRRLTHAVLFSGSRAVVLAASDVRNIPSAIDALQQDLGTEEAGERLRIRCAVPDVEAWLLADDELLRRIAGDDPCVLEQIEKLPPPDEIVDPYRVAHRLLGPSTRWGIVRDMDVYRAAARSPSLRQFVSTMAEALGMPIDLPSESSARTLNREVIAGILREMMPSEAIAWRTSDGHVYTADRISREVEQGTDAGQQYARDVMRAAIDLVGRQARKRKTG